MELTDYEVFQVPPRWVFVRLETADGLVGWGEAGTVSRRADTLTAAITELMEEYLLGRDAAAIEDHWTRMYRGGFYRGGPVLMSAIASLDQALWDLKGKRFDAPAYELLGGTARDRVRLYQHVHGDGPADVGRITEAAVAEGFTAVKTTPTEALERVDSPAAVQEAVDYVTAIREAAGDEVDVALDFHGRVAKSMAKRLAEAVEPLEPMWIEEPVLSGHNDALPGIAAATSAPVATGERMFSRWDFKEVFEDQSVDVIQPDLSNAGGLTEVKKIGAMAEAYDVALAPHCPYGPVALAACVQIDACSPNALIQEQVIHRDGMPEYLADPSVFDHDGGFIDLPDGPGLGIEVDEDAVRAAHQEPLAWETPPWEHPDGSFAEW